MRAEKKGIPQSPRLDVQIDERLFKHYDEVSLNEELVSSTLRQNITRLPKDIPDVKILLANTLFRDMKGGFSTAMYFPNFQGSIAVGVCVNPLALELPPYLKSHNQALAHELKHLIDDLNAPIGLETRDYHKKRDSRLMGSIAILGGALAYRPHQGVERTASNVAMAASGLYLASRAYTDIREAFGSDEYRRQRYEALPWEKRANEFSALHVNTPFIELTPKTTGLTAS